MTDPSFVVHVKPVLAVTNGIGGVLSILGALVTLYPDGPNSSTVLALLAAGLFASSAFFLW